MFPFPAPQRGTHFPCRCQLVISPGSSRLSISSSRLSRSDPAPDSLLTLLIRFRRPASLHNGSPASLGRGHLVRLKDRVFAQDQKIGAGATTWGQPDCVVNARGNPARDKRNPTGARMRASEENTEPLVKSLPTRAGFYRPAKRPAAFAYFRNSHA